VTLEIEYIENTHYLLFEHKPSLFLIPMHRLPEVIPTLEEQIAQAIQRLVACGSNVTNVFSIDERPELVAVDSIKSAMLTEPFERIELGNESINELELPVLSNDVVPEPRIVSVEIMVEDIQLSKQMQYFC
jgi:hypothetical protein